MSSIEEIEKAVASLPPRDLAIFSAWFEAFEAERFDKRICRTQRLVSSIALQRRLWRSFAKALRAKYEAFRQRGILAGVWAIA